MVNDRKNPRNIRDSTSDEASIPNSETGGIRRNRDPQQREQQTNSERNRDEEGKENQRNKKIKRTLPKYLRKVNDAFYARASAKEIFIENMDRRGQVIRQKYGSFRMVGTPSSRNRQQISVLRKQAKKDSFKMSFMSTAEQSTLMMRRNMVSISNLDMSERAISIKDHAKHKRDNQPQNVIVKSRNSAAH